MEGVRTKLDAAARKLQGSFLRHRIAARLGVPQKYEKVTTSEARHPHLPFIQQYYHSLPCAFRSRVSKSLRLTTRRS